MKKKLLIIGIALVLITIGLSGCTDNGDNGANDGDGGTNDDNVNGEYVLKAKASVDNHSGSRPFTFTLSAEGSLGDIVSYKWYCPSTSQKSEGITSTWSQWYLGNYSITLTVTDIYGDTDTDTVFVTVLE
jgi:hypothetical protein